MRRRHLEILASWSQANIFVALFGSLVFESGVAGFPNAVLALFLASYGLYRARKFGVTDQ